MEILQLKMLLMGVMFASTTLVGIAPIVLKGACGSRLSNSLKETTRRRILSCATCFSAGVFLFVCFMGLLPAADSKFHLIMQRLVESDSSLERFSEFPWGFFVVTCSFLVIFTIDKLVHAIEVSRKLRLEEYESTGGTSSSTTATTTSSSTPVSDVTLLSIKGSPTSQSNSVHITTDTAALNRTGNSTATPTLEEYIAITLRETRQKQQMKQINNNLRLVANARSGSKVGVEGGADLQLHLPQGDQPHGGGGLASETHDALHEHKASSGHGVPSSLIFLAALGIHSLFEGAAVGLQTEKEKVLEFGVAVLVHEVVMAFTFGLEVSRSKRLSWVWQMVYVGVFTVCIPLGIAMGAVTLHTTDNDSRVMVAAVMEAIATGIFIHVIFIEVIAKEFPEHHHGHQNSSESHPSNNNNNNNNNNDDKQGPHHAQMALPSDYEVINASDTEDEGCVSRMPKGTQVVTIDGREDRNTRRPPATAEPSEVRLIIEKIFCICLGLLTLILLNVFMHSHH